MGTPSGANDDLHLLIERYERLHQTLERDVLQLVLAHLRYLGLRHGEFTYASGELQNALSRAPFHFVRIARGVAIGDPYYEIRFGEGDIFESRSLEFYGPDGEMYGWIILNASKEPIVWATREYRYTFGPMAEFGNLRVPNWAVYDNGYTFYEMISLSGDSKPPDLSLFQPPDEFRD